MLQTSQPQSPLTTSLIMVVSLVRFFRIFYACFLDQLEILDLRGNKLSHLPKEIGLLEHLQQLDVSKKELEDLPADLALIPGLYAVLTLKKLLPGRSASIGRQTRYAGSSILFT
jgi:Leucine-rich repeat (LRR) protein